MPTMVLVFPTTWMLMGNCVMMFASAYQGGLPIHPATVIHTHMIPKAYAKIENTVDRMRQLDTLVELNFETWMQLSRIKHCQFQELLPKRTKCMACNSSAGPDTYRDLMNFGAIRHAMIFDKGASLGITHCKEDFDGPLTLPEGDLRLGGMAQGMRIEGMGPVT